VKTVAERTTDAPDTVAVLIPVFNDSGLLPSTLRSLRDQGVPVVAVVVDDGSMPSLACDAVSAGVEIVTLRHDANRGIERALNTGLDYIRRRGIAYVARLDNGDQCAAGRLASQRDYLEAHRDVYLVGSAVEWRDDDGRVRFARELPTTHEDIVRTMHHTTALIHPAVMFRTRVMDTVGVYSTAYPAAEDYELFWRIARRHRVANLAETLVVTRFDPNGLSMRRRRQQLRSTLRIQIAYFQPAGWVSWFGVIKTLGRFAIPYSWIVAIKALRNRRSDLAPA
jgi:glycosyltransferase involved in cell wall biosynthesis